MSNIPVSGTKITLDQTYYLAAASSDLFTRIGAAINLLLRNAETQPVGSMIQSMLTEVQFQAIRGTGWILADGRSVAGSAYETLTGISLAPDCRGTYIRGKNNGRSDGNQNPAGDLTLGTFQTYGYVSHGHSTTISGNIAKTVANTSNGIGPTFQVRQTNPIGGAELRSLVVTVNAPNSYTPPTIDTVEGDLGNKSIVVNCFFRIN